MRFALLLLVVLGIAAPAAAQAPRTADLVNLLRALNGAPDGAPVAIDGTSGTTRNATAFPAGSFLLVQATTAANVLPGSSTVTASTSSGIKLAADEKIYILLRANQTHLAVVTGAVRVWVLK